MITINFIITSKSIQAIAHALLAPLNSAYDVWLWSSLSSLHQSRSRSFEKRAEPRRSREFD